VGGLLEGDKDAWLLAIARAMGQKLQGHDGLARTRAAHQQGSPAAWQATAGNFIKAGDSGRNLARRIGYLRGRLGFNALLPCNSVAHIVVL
jgi:hypothetical protein